MATRNDPFASALQTLRSAHRERRERRLTPTMPPPRDSDATIGEALPEHGAGASPPSSDDRGRDALPPPASAWGWTDADSDDGGTQR